MTPPKIMKFLRPNLSPNFIKSVETATPRKNNEPKDPIKKAESHYMPSSQVQFFSDKGESQLMLLSFSADPQYYVFVQATPLHI